MKTQTQTFRPSAAGYVSTGSLLEAFLLMQYPGPESDTNPHRAIHPLLRGLNRMLPVLCAYSKDNL